MNGPRDYHTKPDKEISYDITYIESLFKMMQMKLFTKQRYTYWFRKQIYGYQGDSEEGG